VPDGDNASVGGVGLAGRRIGRRLTDRILIAVHQACDEAELEVAEQLLLVAERLVPHRHGSADPMRRRFLEAVVAAHQRLWHLRNPETGAY
jgi:hypothetical protein